MSCGRLSVPQHYLVLSVVKSLIPQTTVLLCLTFFDQKFNSSDQATKQLSGCSLSDTNTNSKTDTNTNLDEPELVWFSLRHL